MFISRSALAPFTSLVRKRELFTLRTLRRFSMNSPINDHSHTQQLEQFRDELSKAKNVLVLTGAGISAESGISTFRGAGGFWGRYDVTQLATYPAFIRDPSLVWQFYAYRRETVLKCEPNAGHLALAECEQFMAKENRRLTVITQNIDELHQRAGSLNVIELHGSLFKTECIKCGNVQVNKDVPICPALKEPRLPDPDDSDFPKIAEEDLPRCFACHGLLRPHVVWFGENLDTSVLSSVYTELDVCDLCLVVGTSSVVYPAAMFAPQVAMRGVSVAEFNLELTSGASACKYLFLGPAGTTLPRALSQIKMDK